MDVDIQSLDILLIHNEILYENVRNNSIGLIDQVKNINIQINKLKFVFVPGVYTRTDVNEIFEIKVDKTDMCIKTEVNEIIDEKVDKTNIIDM